MSDNSGGRVKFELNSEVHILELDGSIPTTVYCVDQVKSDRKGFVSLRERDNNRTIRVHYRRVLPLSVDGKSVVVETGDKFWALCPTDGQVEEVGAGDDSMTCKKCSGMFPLHWLGVQPMAETATKPASKKPATTASDKKPKAEKAPREPKTVKEPIKVELGAMAKLSHCELWTKKNVKFAQPNIDVQAHVLLFTGDNPRKLCFNTYNGTLGKRASELPTENFVANKGSGKNAPWFAVSDLEKARAKLVKEGYAKH